MNISLGDLLIEIGTAINKYEESNKGNIGNNSKLLKGKQVLELYPILTSYALNDAVKKGLIPVIKRGKLNFYDSRDIEKYLSSLKNIEQNSSEVEEIKPRNSSSRIKFV